MHFDHFRTRLADVRGFSIAEILVAIVVFGILAGIAVPQFIAFRPTPDFIIPPVAEFVELHS